ncbi:MAG: thiazole synthase [Deltaproteobacteria bacterium CG2_30_63_29]|nr:MAG: thiazole synthase [Deltaproteobacteria bacterium CG2_30_63_29]PJB48227.1 MAG: thiazole synthase [Deltaproteobacteria bacterium CG_4_9_14_3_um_filter_63_12]
MTEAKPDALVIAGRTFRSRLMVGTGKFPSSQALMETLTACDAEIVTVALRRVDLSKPTTDSIMRAIDRERHLLLPNTSGARNADEAVRLARMARAAGLEPWVKLEITPEPRYLIPDPIETLRATERLVAEGFIVLPYMQADPLLAKRLEEAGAATVMPLGAPIGSNRGIKTREMILIIIEQSNIPVVIDAGLGAPSHVAEAMEMGADAVLMNTALADARDHRGMGEAVALAIRAGRLAYLSGLGPVRELAAASSPLTGFLS